MNSSPCPYLCLCLNLSSIRINKQKKPVWLGTNPWWPASSSTDHYRASSNSSKESPCGKINFQQFMTAVELRWVGVGVGTVRAGWRNFAERIRKRSKRSDDSHSSKDLKGNQIKLFLRFAAKFSHHRNIVFNVRGREGVPYFLYTFPLFMINDRSAAWQKCQLNKCGANQAKFFRQRWSNWTPQRETINTHSLAQCICLRAQPQLDVNKSRRK